MIHVLRLPQWRWNVTFACSHLVNDCSFLRLLTGLVDFGALRSNSAMLQTRLVAPLLDRDLLMMIQLAREEVKEGGAGVWMDARSGRNLQSLPWTDH